MEASESTGNERGALHVVVVGGGIAGMYCARLLAERGCTVDLLETTDRFGGRVETGELSPGPERDGPPFTAEFGPMRFELDLQWRFKELVDEFPEIEFKDFDPPNPGVPSIQYPVSPADRGPYSAPMTSLELLKLGVYRMFGHEPQIEDEMQVDGQVLGKAVPSRSDEEWLNSLTEDRLDELRATAVLPTTGRPLHELGFWNALYEVLSPPAVAYILHFGTFYHLMPDNPNAVEWAIFWLRLFKLGGKKLSTIPAGVSQVTIKLEDKLRTDWAHVVTMRKSHTVVALRPSSTAGRVDVESISSSSDEAEDTITLTADHVVLALPKEPLLPLSVNFEEVIRTDLHSVIAFPLLKVFCVTKTPDWWTHTPRAQDGAWLAPTREIHYFPTEAPEPAGSRYENTMVLFYTDRPATAYWGQYVVNRDSHDRAEYNGNDDLKRALARVLMNLHLNWAENHLRKESGRSKTYALDEPLGRQVYEAVTQLQREYFEGLPSREEKLVAFRRPGLVGDAARILFRRDEVTQWQYDALGDYAIRDWSYEPFGAAAHAWAPGARSWEARGRLAAFGFATQPDVECLHICGEAFSEYQGFIEGALRTAHDAVDAILPPPQAEARPAA
jgi:hypothetical protein